MDIFEEKEKEKKEKKVFEENFSRQLKIFRISFCTSFLAVGAVLLIMGIIMLNIEQLASYVLIPLGGFFVLIAIIANAITMAIKPDKVYEKYKNDFKESKPIMNTSQISLRILMLETKVKELEEEVERLKENR